MKKPMLFMRGKFKPPTTKLNPNKGEGVDHKLNVKCKDKPCAECPFTNKSLPGYLGPYSSTRELSNAGTHDNGYPCHTEKQKGNVVVCAGAIAYTKKTGKRPKNIVIANMVKQSGDFIGLVFSSFTEMVEHHSFLKKKKVK